MVMQYTIDTWWLILLVFTPFVLGLLIGIYRTKIFVMEMLLKKMDINELEKLLDEKNE
jgi:uncharacterized protein YneF (UPF0154 family)